MKSYSAAFIRKNIVVSTPFRQREHPFQIVETYRQLLVKEKEPGRNLAPELTTNGYSKTTKPFAMSLCLEVRILT